SFSTVMPAVFGSAELVGTFGWVKRFRNGIRVSSRSSSLVLFFCAGWVMLVLLLVWPRYFFPFVWIAIFFILEPLNYWLGNTSLLPSLEQGDWRQVLLLWAGCLVCGFFWEMWNYYSYPKWVYTVPFVDFAHLFEMPLLGYGGYLPFSLELFALYHLSMRILGGKKSRMLLQIIDDSSLPPHPLKGAAPKNGT
ncbi:MAG: hypothetical protein MUO76_07715, partial [Anaerolineaceae bacterium]|nr:hypothetical protein [Anaerolineaceae bacterium]